MNRVCLALLMMAAISTMRAAEMTTNAIYGYVFAALEAFESTGRLVPNPGLDGADIEAFIALLENARLRYLSLVNESSCTEQAPVIAQAARQFLIDLETEFGARVVDSIQEQSASHPTPCP